MKKIKKIISPFLKKFIDSIQNQSFALLMWIVPNPIFSTLLEPPFNCQKVVNDLNNSILTYFSNYVNLIILLKFQIFVPIIFCHMATKKIIHWLRWFCINQYANRLHQFDDLILWSGWWESNPHYSLGKAMFYH